MVYHRLFTVLSVAVLFWGLSSGCGRGGRPIQSPLVGKTMYARSNLYLNGDQLSAVNYRTGTLISIGTPIEVVEIRTQSVTARLADGGQNFVFVPYKTPNVPITDILTLFFSEQPLDEELAALPEDVKTKVEAGEVAPGMSKEAVMMAIGPPPLHANPKRDENVWRYWSNRFNTFEVEFDELGFVKGATTAAAEDENAASIPEPDPTEASTEHIVLYAACNVHNENSVVSWINYLSGPFIPVGAKIIVTARGPESVSFQTADDGKSYRFENDDTKSGVATWVLFTRLFAEEDPSATLDLLTDEDRQRVEKAEVAPGMSKDAVKAAWCPAPPHETPSHETTTWKYWKNKAGALEVHFDDEDNVSKVDN